MLQTLYNLILQLFWSPSFFFKIIQMSTIKRKKRKKKYMGKTTENVTILYFKIHASKAQKFGCYCVHDKEVILFKLTWLYLRTICTITSLRSFVPHHMALSIPCSLFLLVALQVFQQIGIHNFLKLKWISISCQWKYTLYLWY